MSTPSRAKDSACAASWWARTPSCAYSDSSPVAPAAPIASERETDPGQCSHLEAALGAKRACLVIATPPRLAGHRPRYPRLHARSQSAPTVAGGRSLGCRLGCRFSFFHLHTLDLVPGVQGDLGGAAELRDEPRRRDGFPSRPLRDLERPREGCIEPGHVC